MGKIKAFEQEEGQALVIFAFSLIALIGFIALVVDGGKAYAHRIKMQTAADAAAFAGAIRLAEGYPTPVVIDTAAEYARDNGAESANVTIENGDTVHVRVEENFSTLFAAAFGIKQMHAEAEGAAKVDIVGSIGNLFPMSVYDQDFEYGETYELFNGDMEAPGAFGWLDWDGPPCSATELIYRIEHPEASGVWHVGDWVSASPGVKPSPLVVNALREWMGREVTVPLYDRIEGMGCRTRYHISSFGVFIIIGVTTRGEGPGPKLRVYGYFVRKVIENAGGMGTEDRGLHTIELVQ